ncbi:melatonin receptor type 1C-like [Convolutriloba macropyga]|uniref:melatonin receptor type 1C-like n=1 Tax=Convolutriloba macropyga TaxID=536237 RepID=UPI003F51FDCD
MSLEMDSGWFAPEKDETSVEPFEGFREWQWPLDLVESNRLFANRILMLSVLLTALFLGVPGNILVIASIAFVKNLRQVPHLFVVNLAIADLGGLVRNCFILTGVFYGDTVLPKNQALCELSGMVCILACFGSLWTMMFIAINRYMFICKNAIYKRIFSLKGTLACIVLIWTCTLILDSPRNCFLTFLI